jgi:hypothetical protein
VRFRRPDGRPAKLTLGRVDLSDGEMADEPALGGALTLRQVRELANQIDRKRARSIDLVEEYKASKRRQRLAAEERNASGFAAAVREFFADHKTKWHSRPRRWRGDARLLGLNYPLGCDPALNEPEVLAGSLAATFRGPSSPAWHSWPAAAQRRHVRVARAQDARCPQRAVPLAAAGTHGHDEPLHRGVAAVRASGARARVQ